MSDQKGLIDKLGNIPHQVITGLLLLVIALPFLFPVGIPLKITPYSLQIKNALEEVPEGGTILLSLDSAMGGTSETGGAIEAVTKYVVYDRPDVRIIMWGLHYDAIMVFNTFAKDTLEDAEYGTQYVWFGYVPGADAAIAKLSDDVTGILAVDFYGTPTEDLEIMKDINNADDFDLIFTFDTYGHADSYVGHWFERYQTKIVMAVLSGSIPMASMRFTAGQIVGFCGGVKGAAELEKVLGYPGPAYANYDVMNIANIYALALLMIGNLVYFANKTKRGSN